MSARLVTTHGNGDFKCPECDTPILVEWDTEYGDPIIGQHTWEKCPECNKRIGFECLTEYRALKQVHLEVPE